MHSRPTKNKSDFFPGSAACRVSLPPSPDWHSTGCLATSQASTCVPYSCPKKGKPSTNSVVTIVTETGLKVEEGLSPRVLST